jgi:hypothetical protein
MNGFVQESDRAGNDPKDSLRPAQTAATSIIIEQKQPFRRKAAVGAMRLGRAMRG